MADNYALYLASDQGLKVKADGGVFFQFVNGRLELTDPEQIAFFDRLYNKPGSIVPSKCRKVDMDEARNIVAQDRARRARPAAIAGAVTTGSHSREHEEAALAKQREDAMRGGVDPRAFEPEHLVMTERVDLSPQAAGNVPGQEGGLPAGSEVRSSLPPQTHDFVGQLEKAQQTQTGAKPSLADMLNKKG